MGAGFSPTPMALKLASMAAFELRNYIEGALGTWKGRGKGRRGNQPTIKPGSLLGGGRSTASTGMMTKGVNDKHVADPEGSYIFCLEINGIEVAQFLECCDRAAEAAADVDFLLGRRG